ncbi:MAG: carbohydrate ABC transporter permease [Spirochaetales bacterium]|nr:carbohydrate ABC transporter permease [Spirochaetales bacterium]
MGSRSKYNQEVRKRNTIAYVVLVPVSILMIIPLLLLLSTAFKTLPEVMSIKFHWIPETFRLDNFKKAMSVAPFGQYYINTIIVVVMILSVQIVTISLAAYAFARLKFRGRDVIFIFFLVQMLIPPQSIVVPNYHTISSLKLLDTKLAIGLVYFASAYGIFLMRQAFKAIPKELEDSVRIDGGGGFTTIIHVLLPLAKPSLVAFAMVSISYHWNEFFWPLIVTDTKRARLLTVGLALLTQATESSPEWSLTMAATIIVIAPLLLSFIIFQKKFIQSFMHSGLKG